MLAATVSAVAAYRGWRHRRLQTGHRLYIPAPNVLSQDPTAPDFWVFPAFEMADGVHAIVIAGNLINAGPSDAFSVRVYVEPEFTVWGDGMSPLDAAAAVAAAHENASRDRTAIRFAFLDAYKNREAFIPVLRVGEKRSFLVIARLKRGDPYLEGMLESGGGREMSNFWEIEGRQAHGIHAASRTTLGERLVFGPNDLCAPFETDGRLRKWRRWRDRFSRPGSRP